VTWNLVYSNYAIKDAKKLSAAGLRDKAQALLKIFGDRSTSKSSAL